MSSWQLSYNKRERPSIILSGTSLAKQFALNNPHVVDFALRNRSFSSLRLQGFVCLWLKLLIFTQN